VVNKSSKSYWVYVLKGIEGTFYTGIAQDIVTRIKQHNGILVGGAKYTKTRRPWKLVYSEKYKTRGEALKREYEIKQMAKEKKKN